MAGKSLDTFELTEIVTGSNKLLPAIFHENESCETVTTKVVQPTTLNDFLDTTHITANNTDLVVAFQSNEVPATNSSRDRTSYYQQDDEPSFDNPKIRSLFISRVLALVAVGMLITVGIILLVCFNPKARAFFGTLPALIMVIISIVLAHCIGYKLCYCYDLLANNPVLASLSFALMITCQSMILAYLSAKIPDPMYVLIALVATSAIVTIVSVFAATTSIDFTQHTGLIMACCCLTAVISIVGGIAFAVFHWKPLIILAVCASIFLAIIWIIVDIQMLVGGKHAELQPNEYIVGAILIYIDIAFLLQNVLELIWLLFVDED